MNVSTHTGLKNVPTQTFIAYIVYSKSGRMLHTNVFIDNASEAVTKADELGGYVTRLFTDEKNNSKETGYYVTLECGPPQR